MGLIDTRMADMKTNSPNLYQYIKKYKSSIDKKAEVFNIKFDHNPYSCDDLCDLSLVIKRKD